MRPKPDLHFVPAAETIGELEQKAMECERQAEIEPEPQAAKLRETAELCRTWIAQLRSGRWASIQGSH
jgi:hypothetical protein